MALLVLDDSLLRFLLLEVFFYEAEQPIFHLGKEAPSNVVFTADRA